MKAKSRDEGTVEAIFADLEYSSFIPVGAQVWNLRSASWTIIRF
jgi:hypothetical protein